MDDKTIGGKHFAIFTIQAHSSLNECFTKITDLISRTYIFKSESQAVIAALIVFVEDVILRWVVISIGDVRGFTHSFLRSLSNVVRP